MTRRLRRTISTFILAFALLPLSAAAVPVDTTDAKALESEGVQKVTLLRLLNSDSVQDQERAIRLIGAYAHTNRYEEDFFRVLVTPLHGVVAEGKTEALRIMAVSALYSIGTETAMGGLQAQVDSLKPERVQTLTRHALAQYEADRTPAKNDLLQP